MNILVIGNGFDIAHGLPTRYKDFLEFTDNYMSYAKYINNDLLLEVEKLVADNVWLKHFKRLNMDKNWVDFEREISNVIQIIDGKRDEFDKLKEKKLDCVILSDSEREVLGNFDLSANRGIITKTNFISDVTEKMLKDLNGLIRCLDIYLDGYINCVSINRVIPNFEKLNIDNTSLQLLKFPNT